MHYLHDSTVRFTSVYPFPSLSSFLSFSNETGGNRAGHQHVSRQVANTVYIDGMGSVPNSPSESRKDLLGSRASSPAFSNRCASPGVLRKRRSQSSRNDDSRMQARPPTARTSNIRRANSMLIMPSGSDPTASTLSKQEQARSRRPTKPLQRSGTVSAGSEGTTKSTRRLNHLTNTTNSSAERKAPTRKPLGSRNQRDIAVTLVSSV